MPLLPHIFLLAREWKKKGKENVCQTDPAPSPGGATSSLPSSCWKSPGPALVCLWCSSGSGLAGSHVILICFHHGNSKLKQGAEGRQAAKRSAPWPGFFTSIFFCLAPSFLLHALHFHRAQAGAKGKLAGSTGHCCSSKPPAGREASWPSQGNSRLDQREMQTTKLWSPWKCHLLA